MSFRKRNTKEEAELVKRIEDVKSQITERQSYLARLENEQIEGVWVDDIDYSKRPLPEPDCFICFHKESATGVNKCKLEHRSDIVCQDYQHFSKRLIGE